MSSVARQTVTTREAANYTGISYWKLLEMVKAKQIPHIRAGRRILFRVESLDRWMTNQELLNSLPEENTEKGYGKLRKIAE